MAASAADTSTSAESRTSLSVVADPTHTWRTPSIVPSRARVASTRSGGTKQSRRSMALLPQAWSGVARERRLTRMSTAEPATHAGNRRDTADTVP